MSDEEIQALAHRAGQHIAALTKDRLPPATEKRWWAIANTPNDLYVELFYDYPHENRSDCFRKYIRYTGRILAISENGDWGTLEVQREYKQMWESPDHGETPVSDCTALHVLPMGYSILDPITDNVTQISLSDALFFCSAEPVEKTDKQKDISEDYYLPNHGHKYQERYHYRAEYIDVMSMLQSGFGEQRLLELLNSILALTPQDVERVAQKNQAWSLGQEKTRGIDERRKKEEFAAQTKKQARVTLKKVRNIVVGIVIAFVVIICILSSIFNWSFGL